MQITLYCFLKVNEDPNFLFQSFKLKIQKIFSKKKIFIFLKISVWDLLRIKKKKSFEFLFVVLFSEISQLQGKNLFYWTLSIDNFLKQKFRIQGRFNQRRLKPQYAMKSNEVKSLFPWSLSKRIFQVRINQFQSQFEKLHLYFEIFINSELTSFDSNSISYCDKHWQV